MFLSGTRARQVSRPAQEWLELHDVTVLQHVKPQLLRRVARCTGATILTSTDQLGNHLKDKASPLGRCGLFATLAVPSPQLEARIAETAAGHAAAAAHSTLVRGPHLKRERGHG